jgi:hypothetical protein
MCMYKMLLTGRLPVLISKSINCVRTWVAINVANCLVSNLVHLIDCSVRHLGSVYIWNCYPKLLFSVAS